MRLQLVFVATVMVATALAGVIEFRSGSIDTKSTPALTFAHSGSYVALSNALPRSRAGMAPLSADAAPAAVHQDTEDIYIVEVKREAIAGFSAHYADNVVGYLPKSALLLKLTASSASRLANEKAVQWINLYPAEHKVSPALQALLGDEAALAAGAENALESTAAFATSFVNTASLEAVSSPSAVPAEAAPAPAWLDNVHLPPRDPTTDRPALVAADAVANRPAKLAAALNSGGASLSASGLPAHTVSVMLTAPADVGATLAGYTAQLKARASAAASAAAGQLSAALSGDSPVLASAGRFEQQAVRTLAAPMRALGISSPAALVSAFRAPLFTPASAAAAASAAGSLMVPLATAMNTVSPSVYSAPRGNGLNFESLSSIAFELRSPLFRHGVVADVPALVAEAAFNVAAEAARFGPQRYSALAASSPAAAAAADPDVAALAGTTATDAVTPLAAHVAAVTRALAAASAAEHVSTPAASGPSPRHATLAATESSFKALASEPAYHRALAAAAATVLSLQTRWVAQAISATVSDLTAAPDVLFVDLQAKYVPLNHRARWVTTIFDDPLAENQVSYQNQLTPFHKAGISGANNVVGVADSGVDTRSCYFRDTGAVPFGSTAAATHRKFTNYIDFGDRVDEVQGHGTHVCGTIAGNVLSSPSATEAERSSNGIAPDAKISFFDLENTATGDFGVPSNLDDILVPAYNAGARIHSNSWGCYNSFDQTPADACNAYSSSDFYMDRFMKRNDDMLVIVAAGNDGAYAHRTIGSPATAKNIISVGAASQSLNSALENDLGDQTSQPDYYSLTSLASFSSTGPTPDGRMKPDLTAPGHALVSARAGTSSTSGVVTCRTLQMSGTSMATPAVSGTALLVRDYLRQGFYAGAGAASGVAIASPTGNLLKTILVNSGQDMKRKQGAGGLEPAPFARQTASSTLVENRANFALGSLRYAESNSDTRFYIKPTNAGTSIRAAIYVMRGCASTTYTLYTGGINGVSETGDASGSNLTVLKNITISSNYGVRLQITSGATRQCPVYLGILEYEASNPPYARPVSCSATFNSMPSYSFSPSDNKLVDHEWPVSCPPVAECLESRATVQGISMYTVGSSICRAAIHTGSLDLAYSGAQTIAPSSIEYTGTSRRAVLGSSRNGVTSSSGSISGGDYLYMPNIGGYADQPYQNTIPVPASLNTMTGHGSLMLTAALPLADASRPTTNSSRQLAILADGTGNVTDSSWVTRCFLVSHLDELTTYTTPGLGYNYGVGPARVKVTLAYNDYAQTLSAAKAIVNDVDLHVFGPRGEEWRGNNAADRLNSLEQVWLRSFGPGMYCATAHGHYVPLGEQKFAMVASGPGVKSCDSGVPEQYTGNYKVSSFTCTGPSDFEDTFQNDQIWSFVQGGYCLSLRHAPFTASRGFNGLRRSSDSSTQGSYTAEATLAAGGELNDEADGFVLYDNRGVKYDGSAQYFPETDDFQAFQVTISKSSSAQCTLFLYPQSTTPSPNVQASQFFAARYDISEPSLNAAAGLGAGVATVIAAVAALFAVLF